MRSLTGAPFWTLVAEVSVETVDEFFTLERAMMEDGSMRDAMAGYHDLIERGGREIYRVEADATA